VLRSACSSRHTPSGASVWRHADSGAQGDHRICGKWPELAHYASEDSPHLHRDLAHPCHLCARTGARPRTSAPRLGTRLPHLRLHARCSLIGSRVSVCLSRCLFVCLYVCRQVWIALGPSAVLGSQPWETPFGEVTAADLDVLDGTDAVDRPLRFARAREPMRHVGVRARCGRTCASYMYVCCVCVLLPCCRWDRTRTRAPIRTRAGMHGRTARPSIAGINLNYGDIPPFGDGPSPQAISEQGYQYPPACSSPLRYGTKTSRHETCNMVVAPCSMCVQHAAPRPLAAD
jgi:hypothetical protein